MAKKQKPKSAFDSLGFKVFLLGNAYFLIACMAVALYRQDFGYRELAFMVLFFAISAVRAPFVRLTKASVRETIAERREIISIAVLGIGQNILPGLFLATGLLDFADRGWPMVPTLIAGLAAAALGLYILRRAHTDLDVNWSGVLEIREGHKLVTQGVYGLVRHPIYLGFFLNNVAQFFLLDNWLAGPAGFLGFLFMYLRRVPVEEEMMHKEFGEQYEAYIAKTPRVIPNPAKLFSKG